MKKLILITLLLIFSGCAEKLVFVKPPCINMSPIIMPESQQIRVYNDDVELYQAYIKEYKIKIDNQNKLIDKLNSTCDRWSLQ